MPVNYLRLLNIYVMDELKYVKDMVSMYREFISTSMQLTISKNNAEYYKKTVNNCEEWIKNIGYSSSLLYMDEKILNMIYDKGALQSFRI